MSIQTPNSKRKTRVFLMLEGGGIFGAFQLVVLKQLARLLKTPLIQNIDMVCGISVGSIVAGYLFLPQKDGQFPTCDALIEMMKKDGHLVFPQRNALMNKVADFKMLFSSRNSQEGIQRFLKKYFGSRTLSESAIPFLTTAFHAEKEVWKTYASWSENAAQISYREAISASTCMPLFLEAFQNDQRETLLDAGIAGFNYNLWFFLESFKRFPNEDKILISLGTACSDRFKKRKALTKDAEANFWMTMFENLPYKNLLKTQDLIQLNQHGFFSLNAYNRIGKQIDDLVSIPEIIRMAEDYCATNHHQIEQIADQLNRLPPRLLV